MKIVISLGGSLLTKELTSDNFKRYIDTVQQLSRKHKLIVVIGGGKVCREYQKIARELGADRKQLDFVGIMATHLNASTFAAGIKNSYLVRWKSLEDAAKETKEIFGKRVVISAGYDVGTSSDYDAAFLAKSVKADMLINASNVSGVYSDDPKANPNAKKYDRLTYNEFLKVIKKNIQMPGEYRLFDLKAAGLVKKFRIKTILIDGNDPEEIIKAVEGKHGGTVIE